MAAQTYRVLVIDDEPGVREVLRIVLNKAGYETLVAASVEESMNILEHESVDVLLTDLYMGRDRKAGMKVLEYLRENQPYIPAIMITAHGSVESAVEAMRLGALDYLQKPFSSNQEMLLRVARAIEQRVIRRENQAFRADQVNQARLDELVGNSPAFRKVINSVRRVALLPSTVAIYGESGVGKELVARALHTLSPRAQNPFIAINCGSIPESLLESELFGYKRGAFTGAHQDKEGLFVVAGGGTVFLDEIGEMPQSLQVKLLRVLDNSCVTPVGGVSSVKVDVRIISATSRNLTQMIAENTFRSDLFYRLNVIPLTVPPLRDRIEDIPVLTRHLLNRHAASMGCPVKTLAPEAKDALLRYSWPGNIRELSNVLEQTLGLSDNDRIESDDLPEHIRAPKIMTEPEPSLLTEGGVDLERAVEELEINYINQALQATRHSQHKAAKLLGLTTRALRYRLDKYGLS